MELKDLIFLGACALLAPEVDKEGFIIAERKIDYALQLSGKVWQRLADAEEKYV